ncbi:MAG: hypothetical protein EPO23_07820 [Xanthobacteraceae bacterium]|nr:MAG: hypothetical protein EPO23_07820 [Xanthobacteraceae bacterium]
MTTLRTKRDEIIASIRLYERQLEQARADLAHINAAIRIFEASGDAKDMPRYVDVHRLFKRGEPMELCKAALAGGPKTTRELALYVMQAKGLDTDDKVLAKGIGSRLIHALRMQASRGKIVQDGKSRGVSVWRSQINNL